MFRFSASRLYKFLKKQRKGKNLVDARSNLIEMHLIQSLKNEFSFDLPMFSKYPATSINSYFYKMTLIKILFLFLPNPLLNSGLSSLDPS